jgi:DNA repair protein RadC
MPDAAHFRSSRRASYSLAAPERWDDASLLAALLGRAAAAVAAVLPVAELLEADAVRLARLGLGPAARRRLLASAELARRFQPALRAPRPLASARDVLPYLAPLRSLRTEVLAVLPLDARLGPLGGIVRVAEGTVAHVCVEAREVFAPALERRAAAIVLAHNHPSGVPDPSPEDVDFTRTMGQAGTLLGIPVVDHLVVARRGYFSFREAGMRSTGEAACLPRVPPDQDGSLDARAACPVEGTVSR